MSERAGGDVMKKHKENLKLKIFEIHPRHIFFKFFNTKTMRLTWVSCQKVYKSKGPQVKRVYKSKGPQVKRSTSQKVPSQKVPGQKVYKNLMLEIKAYKKPITL